MKINKTGVGFHMPPGGQHSSAVDTRELFFFGDLADILATRRPLLRMRNRQRIFVAGQESRDIYLVVKGLVKTTATAPSGRSCLLDIYPPDEIFGISGLVSPVRLETATTMAPTVACKMSREMFLSAVSRAGIVTDCLHYLADRLTDRERQVANLTTLDCEHRLAMTLLRLSAKIGVSTGSMTRINYPITHQELAEMVGTTRSRVGSFLAGFRSRGIVGPKHRGCLTVSPDRLTDYLQVPTRTAQA